MAKQVALSIAKEKLSEIVDDVRRGEEAVIIRKHDRPVAAIVEIERYQRMQEIEDRFTQLELRAALKGKKFRLEQVLSELGITS